MATQNNSSITSLLCVKNIHSVGANDIIYSNLNLYNSNNCFHEKLTNKISGQSESC